MSLMKKFTSIGGLIALAQSPAGRRAIAKAQQLASDPKTRQKIAEFAGKINKKGQTPPTAR